jgi:EAL domain-containing protein (putative c-di-GMP-specific phosphodiesterase class I)
VRQDEIKIQSGGRARNLSVCAAVQAALRDDRLLFAFQPVVCAATGKVDYFECLLRMRDPEGNILVGSEFITTIEQLGLIGPIDDYVLERTVRELGDHPGVKLGLNISRLTACNRLWLQSLIFLVRSRPEVAGRLVIEITETAAFRDIEESAHFVDMLHGAGCRVALDDFGAGHTSLRQLESLAVDTVKIDGSLIRNVAYSQEKRVVVRDLLEFMKGFGFVTVAEGIENAEDAAYLRVEGVGYLQGYYLGLPTTERSWVTS